MADPTIELKEIKDLMSIALDGPTDRYILRNITMRLDCLIQQVQMTTKQKQQLQKKINHVKELHDLLDKT
jgi:hypothetical protein